MAHNGLRREIASLLHMVGDGEPFMFMPANVEELKQIETVLVRTLKALGGPVMDNRPLAVTHPEAVATVIDTVVYDEALVTRHCSHCVSNWTGNAQVPIYCPVCGSPAVGFEEPPMLPEDSEFEKRLAEQTALDDMARGTVITGLIDGELAEEELSDSAPDDFDPSRFD